MQDPLLYTVLGAAATGVLAWVGIILKYWVGKNEKEQSEGSVIRLELRARVEVLERKVDAVTADNEAWKIKYFNETSDLKALNATLKSDIATLKIQLNDIKERYIPIDKKKEYQ